MACTGNTSAILLLELEQSLQFVDVAASVRELIDTPVLAVRYVDEDMERLSPAWLISISRCEWLCRCVQISLGYWGHSSYFLPK